VGKLRKEGSVKKGELRNTESIKRCLWRKKIIMEKNSPITGAGKTNYREKKLEKQPTSRSEKKRSGVRTGGQRRD